MKAQELSRKYATAIFSLALERWLTTLTAVQQKLAADPALLERLQDSAVPFSERQQTIDGLVPPGTDQPVKNFLYTLLENQHLDLLDDVLNDLQQMARGGPQVQVALITTAVELSDEEKEQFRRRLRARYGENLEFTFRVDPSILGGAVVQVGDKVIDGSVAARLEAMSNALGVKH